jgi:ribosomal protein S30
LGFTPTAKLAAQHEAEPRVKERVKYQFQVTKLRNWRTGYQRLLVLYEQDFVTLDPDSLAVTNRWSYNNISSWQALKEGGSGSNQAQVHLPRCSTSRCLDGIVGKPG